VTFFMMGYLLINRPVQSLAGVLVMLAGLIIYAIARYYPAVPAAQKATP
jgi:APA family basic amino acid/polyamine antiporter